MMFVGIEPTDTKGFHPTDERRPDKGLRQTERPCSRAQLLRGSRRLAA